MKAYLSVLLFLIFQPSFASDMRYYDVEIIVIENKAKGAIDSEHWPLAVNIEKKENMVILGELPSREWLPEEANLEHSYKMLASDEYRLTEEIKKISKSRTQRVIFHTAWRQPGLAKDVSLPVYIKFVIPDPLPADSQDSVIKIAGEIEPKEALPLDNELQNTSTDTAEVNTENLTETNEAGANPLLAQEETTEESTEELNLSSLEGLFRVSLSRFLHLEAELIYKPKTAEAADSTFSSIESEEIKIDLAASKQQGIIYFKQQRNRIRRNELHYLDHPVLGVLVRMTPYEIPVEEINPAPMLNQL